MTDQLYACTLSAAGLAQASAVYVDAARCYQSTVEYRADAALVTLRGDKGSLAALLDDMIAREGGCCTHLTIDPSETADGYRVALHVSGEPELAHMILRQTIPVLFPTAEEAAS